MKRLFTILTIAVLVAGFVSCTKKSNCEMVEGGHFTGYYEYYEDVVAAGICEFNYYIKHHKGFLIIEDHFDSYYLGLEQSSIPHKYRKDGLRIKVNATYKLIEPSGAYIPEDLHYKLLCIEEVE